MIRRAAPGSGTGWLVPLADLSMILFMVTGVSLAQAGAAPVASRAEVGAPGEGGFAMGVPQAVFVDRAGGPALAEWLSRLPTDASGQLTVHGTYAAAGQRAAVTRRTTELADQALAAGRAPRVVIEAGAQQQVLAVIAHDRDPRQVEAQLAGGQVARSLLPQAQ